MPGLILEGGTFRPIFSCGVMDALLDHEIYFPYVSGVSAGISDGTSYISRQKGRNLELLRRFRGDKRYLGLRNYLTDRSLFGVKFAFDTIPNRLLPFDWDTYRAFDGRILVGVTNAETGRAEYLDGHALDKPCTMLRATCAIPLFFPPVDIGGTLYFDGGIADPIPIRKSLQDGNTRNLIVLTQPLGYRKTASRGSLATARHFRRRWPNLSQTLLRRPKVYNDTVCLCHQLAAQQPENTVLIQPKTPIDSFEKDIHALEAAYREGYALAEAQIDAIRHLFREK